MAENGAFGKRVFFLYPPPVLNDVVEELARQEFEVYLARDPKKVKRALKEFPESILFINLDEGLSEPEWAAYVQELRADPATASVGVGIVCMNEDKALQAKYLMELQVPCGFVVLKIGAAKTAEILAKTLEANEARGRRRFVRALCAPGAALCVVEQDGETLRGELSDLSSAGMALRFEGGKSLRPGTMLRSLQLSVKGARVLADGFVAARHEGEDSSAHVVMFDPKSLDDSRRDKLRSLVCKINQGAMDRLFETF
jgi:hypothetical protein